LYDKLLPFPQKIPYIIAEQKSAK